MKSLAWRLRPLSSLANWTSASRRRAVRVVIERAAVLVVDDAVVSVVGAGALVELRAGEGSRAGQRREEALVEEELVGARIEVLDPVDIGRRVQRRVEDELVRVRPGDQRVVAVAAMDPAGVAAGVLEGVVARAEIHLALDLTRR